LRREGDDNPVKALGNKFLPRLDSSESVAENNSVKDKEAQKKIVDPLVELLDEIARTSSEKKNLTLKTRLKFLYRFTQLSKLSDADKDVQWFKSELGKYFRARREAFKLKQEDVGKRALMTGRTISNIESGNAAISSYPFAIIALEFCILDRTKSSAKEKAETLNVDARDVSA
jgi:DNA-binding XRE family transcriptional regulator